MITKLYNYIKENIKFFITLILIFIVFTFEFPYYIDLPGGLLDVSTRVSLEEKNEISGSFNLTYVEELRATIPSLIYSYFNKDSKIIKKEEVIATNETIEENDYRNKLLLEESKDNAVIVGFTKAKEDIEISNRKVYVIYIDEQADTSLKIKDQIIKINGIKISSKEEINKIISSNDEFKIEVINDGKTYVREASKINGKIGIILCETKDILIENEVTFNFDENESGPSGGFMMALSIYNYLEEDLTKGRKIVGTGTIDEDGTVGSIGGIEFKVKTASKNKADIFFVPIDNYEDAYKTKEENNLDVNIVKITNIDEAINYLKNN